MNTLILLTALLAADNTPVPPQPPPFTKQQIGEIQELIRTTVDQDKAIKSQLAKWQKELLRAYSDFQLDERLITRLQTHIIDLQRQLLVNYHQLQLGLRRIAGPERFERLKRRIDHYLESDEPAKATIRKSRS